MIKIRISLFILLFSFVSLNALAAKDPVVAPSYAWSIIPPLGLHEPATLDTLLLNYSQRSVPSAVSSAYASTGNLGAPGMNMIYFDREQMSDFFFRDAIRAWIPPQGEHTFYNTRIPMTMLSYNTGGGKETTQDRLKAVFSGNVNAKLQFGAFLDYLYSKGSYENQAVKDLGWGFSTSYIGDRYELQAFYNHYNNLNKENGGITDDRYITDPAALQGGATSVNTKNIPTYLSASHNRVVGQELYINNRYKVGYWHVTPPNDTIPGDTIEHRTYIPVSSFIWTLDYKRGRHMFDNTDMTEDADVWENTYVSTDRTRDVTKYWSFKNTLGVSLLEGFHKYAKAGLSAYLTHEIRKYELPEDQVAIGGDERPEWLTPYPYTSKVQSKATENLLWVGAQLTKQTGSLFRYEATAKIGVVGDAAGELDIDGQLSARIKLFGDTVTVTGYGRFANLAAPYLMNHYTSNHFIWENDFGKIRTLRFGGILDLPFSGTRINVGAENAQNYIYFNEQCMPTQHGGSVQVFSASLEQNFRVGILNWNNRVTYQTSSDESVLPMPKLAVYSNLYILFRIARVLQVQFGVDCDYYSKYYAPGYQPATMSFYNQRSVEVGNYPFMNAYINFKLSKARFYILMSHVNQGLTGNNYFALPHYPMNPRRFQMGVAVDFAN